MQRRAEAALRTQMSIDNARAARESKWVSNSQEQGRRIIVEVRAYLASRRIIQMHLYAMCTNMSVVVVLALETLLLCRFGWFLMPLCDRENGSVVVNRRTAAT